MQDHRGLETIGTVYFTVSCLAALGFLIAMFRLPGDMSWLMIGSGVGVVLQGFTIQAVLGWMSVTAIELTGIRSELKSLKTTRRPPPYANGKAARRRLLSAPRESSRRGGGAAVRVLPAELAGRGVHRVPTLGCELLGGLGR